MFKSIKELDEVRKNNPGKTELVGSMMSELYDEYTNFIVSRKDPYVRSAGVHASEVSGCLRRMVYSMKGTEPNVEFDISWKKRFMVGHAIHDMLQKQFIDFSACMHKKNWNLRFEKEVAINPKTSEVAKEFNIHSSADGLFTLSDESNTLLRCVLEIKTESPISFTKLTKPKPEHVEQAHVYMACLDAPFTWFLYWNKGDQNHTQPMGKFLIEFDHNIWKNIVSKINKANSFLELQELPNREESPLCSFCSYSYTCEPSSKNRIGQNHLLVNLGSKVPGRK